MTPVGEIDGQTFTVGEITREIDGQTFTVGEITRELMTAYSDLVRNPAEASASGARGLRGEELARGSSRVGQSAPV